MIELKPCSFCGGEAHLHKEMQLDTTKTELLHDKTFEGVPILPTRKKFEIVFGQVCTGWLAECDDCGARGALQYTEPIQTQTEAAELWNIRHI